MIKSYHLTRRQFIQTSTIALSTVILGYAETPPAIVRSPLWCFSKPFADYTPEQTAELVAEVGWDGIECPVREKTTHIRPERVEEDLPKMVEALRKCGKKVGIVTTDITSVTPMAEKILRTMVKLDIRQYRMGFMHYPKDRPVPEILSEFTATVKDLSALNRELGLQGGYQNHSGSDYIGGTMWDLWLAMKDIDPATMGICFDIGQAMIEGGLSWPTQARLTEKQWVAVQIKDFYWDKDPKGKPLWCALGEGRVPRAFFTELKNKAFAGPIIQHHEHLKLGMPKAELLAALKKEYSTLREWLS